MPTREADGATTLHRGLAILLALADEPAGAGVVALADRLGEDKSQVSRSLKALAGWELVERDERSRAFRLGKQFFALAARAVEPRLLAAAPTCLAELVAVLGETAHLSVLRGAEVLTIASEAPPAAIQATGWIGHAVPAYAGSAGRALLVDRSRAELDALLGAVAFERLAPATPAGVDDLWARIEEARAAGYAVAADELEVGLVGVAAPVRDFVGRTVAAVNVSGPSFRFQARVSEAGLLLGRAAERLSALVGAERAA